MHRFDDIDEMWMRCLFSSSPIAMALVSADHRYFRCNDAYCALTGYSRSELLKRTWQSITHQDDIDGDLEGALTLQRKPTAEVYTATKRYITKPGECIWISLHVRAVRDNGKFVCYYVVAVPIQSNRQPIHAIAQPPKTILQWVKDNPKDAIIVGGAACVFLSRDALVELIRLLLMK